MQPKHLNRKVVLCFFCNWKSFIVEYDYWKLDNFVADPYQIFFFKSDIPSRAAASTKANQKKVEKVKVVEKMVKIVEENEEDEEEEDDEDFTAEEGDTGSDPGSEPSDQEEEEEEEDEEVEPKVSLQWSL